MIANLPMYDRPELTEVHDAYWHLIRKNLLGYNNECPEKIDYPAGEMDCWTSPDFFFSQTCGRPYVNHLVDQVSLIGTPDYNLEGCPVGYYPSAYVINKSA
jgi:hypothetical protein